MFTSHHDYKNHIHTMTSVVNNKVTHIVKKGVPREHIRNRIDGSIVTLCMVYEEHGSYSYLATTEDGKEHYKAGYASKPDAVNALIDLFK